MRVSTFQAVSPWRTAIRRVASSIRGILEALLFFAVAVDSSMFTRRSPCGGFGKPCRAAWNITGRIAALEL
jgi:hypothetical protein